MTTKRTIHYRPTGRGIPACQALPDVLASGGWRRGDTHTDIARVTCHQCLLVVGRRVYDNLAGRRKSVARTLAAYIEGRPV